MGFVLILHKFKFKVISKINENLFKKIVSQLINVFIAKRGSLYAWFWSSREIAHQKGLEFIKHDSQCNGGGLDLKVEDVQHLTPSHNTQVLDCIVQSNQKRLPDQY